VLLTLFALQHFGMARPAFKRWLTQYIPNSIERSTYVLFSNVAMIALFAAWQPMSGTIWSAGSGVGQIAIYSLYAMGWLLVLYATFLINHFDLFGLRQVWLYFQSKPYKQLQFRILSVYRYVRHPLYAGWITVMWSTPTMTLAHLMFAAITTSYILVAVIFEERDLIDSLGKDYAEYREKTPMLIPRLASGTRMTQPGTAA